MKSDDLLLLYIFQSLILPEKFQHILRLMNTNIDGRRKVMFAMTAIKGVGRRYSNIVLKKADIDQTKRAGELTEEEVRQMCERMATLNMCVHLDAGVCLCMETIAYIHNFINGIHLGASPCTFPLWGVKFTLSAADSTDLAFTGILLMQRFPIWG